MGPLIIMTQPVSHSVCRAAGNHIQRFSERGQGRKTELIEACDFMGIKPKNSS